MADSEAVRSRRKRAHAAGDHSLCRRCAAVRGRPEKGGYSAGRLSVSELPPPPALICAEVTDAASELRQLAARMAEAHRGDPSNAILGAELRKTLLELMPKGKQDADADLTGLFGALQA
jgi:hypothetical protein